MSKTVYVTRTQTLLIVKQNNPLFKTIDDLAFKAKKHLQLSTIPL